MSLPACRWLPPVRAEVVADAWSSSYSSGHLQFCAPPSANRSGRYEELACRSCCSLLQRTQRPSKLRAFLFSGLSRPAAPPNKLRGEGRKLNPTWPSRVTVLRHQVLRGCCRRPIARASRDFQSDRNEIKAL